MIITVIPVLRGSGKPLFSELSNRLNFECISSSVQNIWFKVTINESGNPILKLARFGLFKINCNNILSIKRVLMSLNNWILLITLSIVWGGSFYFVGMIILLLPKGFGNFELAGAFAIIAAISYAFAGVFGKKLKEYDPIFNVFGMLTASSIIMYLIFFPSINSLEINSFYEFKDLILLAIVSTSIAYIIYFRLLFSVGAVKLLLVTYLIPISASILGIFLLDEEFTYNMLLGTGVIFVSLWLINKK